MEETQKKGEGQLTNQDNWSICPFLKVWICEFSLYIYMCITFFFCFIQEEYGSLGLFRFIKLPYSRIQEDGFSIIQEGGRDIGVGIAATFL